MAEAGLREAADLLNLAGEYFLRGPRPETHTLLADAAWRDSLRRAGVLGGEVDGRETGFEEHRRRFEAVLRVPGGDYVPPYEQGHVDEGPPGTPPRSVECDRLYKAAGYRKAPFEAEQADHVGHQLRFLAALAAREEACRARGDDEEVAARVASWRTGFLREHGAWWSRLAERMERAADCRELRTMASLLPGLQRLLA